MGKGRKKDKKVKKPKKPVNLYKSYKAEGEGLKRENKFCPKCGQGVFMAKHANRLTCGKCQYTEFVKEEK
ncbi:MAG: 30S ribosomal protein S27ae [Nanoarchaeota archaeon]|nr:30S ribosomal protein S27ae [Nanoarchaeota archaeon]